METNQYYDLVKDLPEKINEIIEASKSEIISETYIKDAIENFFEKLKSNISEEAEIFANQVIKNLPENNLKSETKELNLEEANVSTQVKIKGLMDSLEKMIEAAEVNERIIIEVRDKPIEKLFTFDKSKRNIEFSNLKLDGKELFNRENELLFERKYLNTGLYYNTKILQCGKLLILDTNDTCSSVFCLQKKFNKTKQELSLKITDLNNAGFFIGIAGVERDFSKKATCFCSDIEKSMIFDYEGNLLNEENLSNLKKDFGGEKKSLIMKFCFDLVKNSISLKIDDKEEKTYDFKLKSKSYKLFVGCCKNVQANVQILN